MKKLLSYLTLGLMMACSAPQQEQAPVAQEFPSTPPSGEMPRGFTLPEREEYTLDNGLKVVLIPWGDVPKADVVLVTQAGYANESSDQVWLTRLLSGLMEEGSENLNAAEIADTLAAMGGNLSVNVQRHITTVQASVLYEFTPQTVSILADVLARPALPASEEERIKNDLKRSVNVSKSRQSSLVTEKFYETLFPDHPYSQIYPAEGQIDTYGLAEAKAFYEANYGAKRSIVYVAGMFDTEAVKEAINTALASWQPGPEPYFPEVDASPVPGVQIIDRPGAVQSTIRMGVPVLAADQPDYTAMEITNSILGGSFSSRITSNIREDKGYTYSPFGAIINPVNTSIWIEQADVTTDVTAASIIEINKEINRLREEPPTEEELQAIKNSETGLFILQNASGSGLINQLIFMEYQGLDESYLTGYVDRINAVTPEKVQQMAQQYINPEALTIIIAGDKKLVEQQLNDKKSELDLKVK